MTLGSSVLNFDGNNRSTIELNSSDVDSNNGSYIVIEAYNEEHTSRIYYTTDKSLRIYASDYDTNPEALPYIIKR